jgi:hypothetical protein
MRVVWAGFLLTGLVLVGLSIYEDGRTSQDVQTSEEMQSSEETYTVSAMEDGTPMPPPNPKR